MNCVFCLSELYLDEHFAAPFQDFRHLEGTHFYCDPQAEKQLRKTAQDQGPDGIHHIDLGDYHYISLFFLQEIQEPFSLVLFDHHPDDQPGALNQGMLSCGNWVKFARESLPQLHEVVWFGGPDAREPRPGLPVYVSIDLDVLSRDEFVTDWDQGAMTVEELRSRLERIRRSHRIIGVDVCGGLTRAQGASDADLKKNERIRTLISRDNMWSAFAADTCK